MNLKLVVLDGRQKHHQHQFFRVLKGGDKWLRGINNQTESIV